MRPGQSQKISGDLALRELSCSSAEQEIQAADQIRPSNRPDKWFAFVLSLGLVSIIVGLAPWFHSAGASYSGGAEEGHRQAVNFCPDLPPPTGKVVNVEPSQSASLDSIVRGANPGDTILLADGTYQLQGDYLWFDTPSVSMRSASGNREAVIVDGGYQTTEIVVIAASDVTIADLTLKRAKYHPIHVMSTNGWDTLNSKIYNVHIIDPGQQAIKINPATPDHYPDKGEIACSHIELTDAGRQEVWNINGSCYTGGVDAHQALGWTVRDNFIEGFWCSQGLSEHGVHFWRGSRDTIVERNTFFDNARGIGFGLTETGSGRSYDDDSCPLNGYVGHYGGIIRNNFLFQGRPELASSQSGFECGVCLAQACEAKVFHNSVVSLQQPFSSIEWRFANTQAEIVNNLVSHNLMERGKASASLAGNLENAPTSLFVNAAAGDLHLRINASAAINRGVPRPSGMTSYDIDGDIRADAPDLGADEWPLDLSESAFIPLILGGVSP